MNRDSIVITPTAAGIYTYQYSITKDGCTSSVAQVIVRVNAIPEKPVITVQDANVCEGAQIRLTAPNIPNATYAWTGPNGFTAVSNPVIINGAAPENAGDYSLRVTLNGCTSVSSEPVRITVTTTPDAMDDRVEIEGNATATFNVLTNDLTNQQGVTVTLLSTPPKGMFQNQGNGNFTFRPNANFVNGQSSFSYQICYEDCPDLCDFATVTIAVNPNRDSCDFITTIITPNNDNVNDAFKIPCLDSGGYPSNEVFIYNQWGDLIYQASPYDNSWKGTFEGKPVPDGTYYYIFWKDRGLDKPITGFLTVYR